MVHISEEPEGDPTERLNLDDYNSDDFDEYLFDNMETTPPTIIEPQATTKQDPPAPSLAVTVTVQLEEQQKISMSVVACLTKRGHSGASASLTTYGNSRATTMTTPTVTTAV